jgi:hypothetical protein
MPSEAAQKTLDGRLLAVIEQVANFAAAVQSDEEALGLVALLEALLQVDSEAFRARADKAVPKISAVALSLLKRPETVVFGLLLLRTVLSSSYRPSGQQSLGATRAACLEVLALPEASALAADCVALSVMGDGTENWAACWRNYAFSAVAAVQALGVAQHVPLPRGGRAYKDLPLAALSGAAKALLAERVLRGSCLGLTAMLRRGCASGPVSTDLTGVLACAHAVLGVQLDVAQQEASSAAAGKLLVERDW